MAAILYTAIIYYKMWNIDEFCIIRYIYIIYDRTIYDHAVYYNTLIHLCIYTHQILLTNT